MTLTSDPPSLTSHYENNALAIEVQNVFFLFLFINALQHKYGVPFVSKTQKLRSKLNIVDIY